MADGFDDMVRRAAARREAQAKKQADKQAARTLQRDREARSTWKPSADELHKVGVEFAKAARSGGLTPQLLLIYSPPFIVRGWTIYTGHAASGGGSRHGESWSGSRRSPRLGVTVTGKVLSDRRGAKPGDFPAHALRQRLVKYLDDAL